MPKFLIIGADSRLQMIDDLAAIAELDPIESDGVRFFEATWQAETLRVETMIVRDQDLIVTRAADTDFLLLVISESDGIMPMDAAELAATPDRIELAGVCFTNLQPDPDVRQLVQLEITETVKTNRPRWKERFLTEDCNTFFHILKTSFFTDCL